MRGTVKWYNPEKGYGFITPDDGTRDVFVHIRQIERASAMVLNEGDKILFDVVTDRRSGKPEACDLKIGR